MYIELIIATVGLTIIAHYSHMKITKGRTGKINKYNIIGTIYYYYITFKTNKNYIDRIQQNLDLLDVLFIRYRFYNNNIVLLLLLYKPQLTRLETLTTGSDSDHDWDDSVRPNPNCSVFWNSVLIPIKTVR